MSQAYCIHWFRRDLRLTDNTSLYAAATTEFKVIPLYILSNWNEHHPWTGAKRQHFLCESLASLSQNLKQAGSHLVIRQGNAKAVFEELIRTFPIKAIHTNADPDVYGKQIEAELAQLCLEYKVEWHVHHDVTLHPPEQVLNGSGLPYRVYTPFSKNWLAQDKPCSVPTVKRLEAVSIESLPLPAVEHWGLSSEPSWDLLKGGERAALDRMHEALDDIVDGYGAVRNIPAGKTTSRLSQDLRFGLISIRSLYHQCVKRSEQASASAQASIHIFIKELAWREFYFAILHYFPEVLEHEFNPDWRGLPWSQNEDALERWKRGETGFPIVDAGMRELAQTGFMHNRVRMIVAMFLTKDLHLDWRLGEAFFMQHLLDGEIASNNGGWQWSAGVGADAAPYFRIQNPWMQTERFDPHGTYIKKWIPELEHVPAKCFAQAPKDNRALATGYPLPMVDHHTERNAALAMFATHKNSLQG